MPTVCTSAVQQGVDKLPGSGSPDDHFSRVLISIKGETDFDSWVRYILVVEASLKVGQGSGAAC